MTDQKKISTDKRRRNRRRTNWPGKATKDPKQHRSQRSKGSSRWNRHRLSQHFMRRDFDSRRKDCSCKGNFRISMGLIGIIEAIRAKYGKRIEVLNGYYCPDCRPKQYGMKRNFHYNGLAADIHVESIDVRALFLGVESFKEINGLGLNLDDQYVHVDTRKSDEREMWVIHNNERILLTEANRSLYLSDTLDALPETDGNHKEAVESKPNGPDSVATQEQ